LSIFVIPARGRAVACAIRAEKFSTFSEDSQIALGSKAFFIISERDLSLFWDSARPLLNLSRDSFAWKSCLEKLSNS